MMKSTFNDMVEALIKPKEKNSSIMELFDQLPKHIGRTRTDWYEPFIGQTADHEFYCAYLDGSWHSGPVTKGATAEEAVANMVSYCKEHDIKTNSDRY